MFDVGELVTHGLERALNGAGSLGCHGVERAGRRPLGTHLAPRHGCEAAIEGSSHFGRRGLAAGEYQLTESGACEPRRYMHLHAWLHARAASRVPTLSVPKKKLRMNA